jgi:hypothetical protein
MCKVEQFIIQNYFWITTGRVDQCVTAEEEEKEE